MTFFFNLLFGLILRDPLDFLNEQVPVEFLHFWPLGEHLTCLNIKFSCPCFAYLEIWMASIPLLLVPSLDQGIGWIPSVHVFLFLKYIQYCQICNSLKCLPTSELPFYHFQLG